MKQSKHNVKPIALYLDRGFVFLGTIASDFFASIFGFYFRFLHFRSANIKKVKVRHIKTLALVFEAFFFSFFEIL